ncbi:MAG: Flp pilus assembly complex ATPase component TadA [Bdellovibrionales bacterium]|nr:Flp pilus assembly complex ATPase component TadA [Bdellovibrionales bacterium]
MTDSQAILHEITQKIHESETFFEAMPDIEPLILEFLQSERVTVYSRGRSDKEIVSKFLSSDNGDQPKEIRVPLNTESIAGYVAMSQQPVRIKDVYEDETLTGINERLRFNKSFDKESGFRTKSVLAVPIKFKDVFLGVLQALNRRDQEEFSELDQELAMGLAKVLAQKFRYELRGTRSPYDYLVMTKKIHGEKLKELSARANNEGTSLEELLISSGGVSKAELGESFSRYYQVPYMGFDAHHTIPPELLKGINLPYLRESLWVPIDGHPDDEVIILIDNPGDAQRIMEIQRILPARKYVFRVGFAEDILRYLGQGGQSESATANIHDLVGKLQEEAGMEVHIADEEDEEAAEDEATVIQLVNRIIIDSYRERASDIHIEPAKGKANATVRIRVDGSCRPSLSIPHTHVRAVVSRIKIMSGLDISERRKPQDGKCVIKYRGNPIELRVATVPTVNGESVVMRILASSEPIPLEKLNFAEDTLTKVKHIVSQPHGVFLVVGPTGSGKTTTLHSILGSINTPDKKIWTAEDPVEITQPGLNQVQMKNEIGLNFAAALRSFLRADPDVIMIGEMRDHETAHIGVEASLTGHFVFSTLHTNSAPETVTRLLDLDLDPVSFSDALQGVLAQRLVRTLCGECKESYKIPQDEYTTLERYYGEEYFSELNVKVNETEIFHAKGCQKCGNTGYYGRTGIHELLVNTEAIKTLIYRKAGAGEIKAEAMKNGMRTLMQDGIRKLFLGQTDIVQVRKVAGS